MPKFLRFKIFDEGWFLVFGVSNAKYLAFNTPDGNALTSAILGFFFFLFLFFFLKEKCYHGIDIAKIEGSFVNVVLVTLFVFLRNMCE